MEADIFGHKMSSSRQAKAMAVLDDNAQEWKHGYISCYLPKQWKKSLSLPIRFHIPMLRKRVHEYAIDLPRLYDCARRSWDKQPEGIFMGHGIWILLLVLQKNSSHRMILHITKWFGRKKLEKGAGNFIIFSRHLQSTHG